MYAIFLKYYQRRLTPDFFHIVLNNLTPSAFFAAGFARSIEHYEIVHKFNYTFLSPKGKVWHQNRAEVTFFNRTTTALFVASVLWLASTYSVSRRELVLEVHRRCCELVLTCSASTAKPNDFPAWWSDVTSSRQFVARKHSGLASPHLGWTHVPLLKWHRCSR